ncbi:nicotinamide riboside transporter PnuC [Legionella sp. D16C41]|uniref:nicotinamide riboside transporter PnuC n=1 Tax=Legionella sp. D16C41 TaxID=3402688 RepID=UPI003AF828FA
MFLDILGTCLSLLATIYFIRLNSYGWLISLVATSLNSLLYWQKGIYADMLLEIFYFITSCYGWFKWRQPSDNEHQSIQILKAKQWYILLTIILSLFLSIKFILTFFTNSDVAILDALTTSLSLAGQWLMCYKFIATWIVWLITDALYAYLYLQKNIPFHTLLMIIYTLMALYGYHNWSKILKYNSLKKKKLMEKPVKPTA